MSLKWGWNFSLPFPTCGNRLSFPQRNVEDNPKHWLCGRHWLRSDGGETARTKLAKASPRLRLWNSPLLFFLRTMWWKTVHKHQQLGGFTHSCTTEEPNWRVCLMLPVHLRVREWRQFCDFVFFLWGSFLYLISLHWKQSSNNTQSPTSIETSLVLRSVQHSHFEIFVSTLMTHKWWCQQY